MKYYLHDGEQQHGPFTVEELSNHPQFKSDSLIWYDGIKDWTKADQVQELKEFFRSVPPPLSKPPAFTQSESKVVTPTIQTPKSTSSSSSWRTVIVIILIVIIGYAAFGLYDQQQRANRVQEAFNQEQAEKKRVRDNIRSYVQVGNSEYQVSGLGGVYGLSISINNQSDYLLDNVRVLIRYIKANGETWKEENLDFALVPPNKKMTLRAPDSDRGTSIDYKIVSIKSSALGL